MARTKARPAEQKPANMAVFYGITCAADLGELWLSIFGAEADADRLREMADLDACQEATGAFSGLPEWEDRLSADTLDEWRRHCAGADTRLAAKIPAAELARYVDREVLGEYILTLNPSRIFLTDGDEAVFDLSLFRANPIWIEQLRMAQHVRR